MLHFFPCIKSLDALGRSLTGIYWRKHGFSHLFPLYLIRDTFLFTFGRVPSLHLIYLTCILLYHICEL